MSERSKEEVGARLAAIADFLARAGKKGGESGKGASKVRGDTDYYKRISAKAAAARKKKALDSGTGSKK
jgi:hypothetical protein